MGEFGRNELKSLADTRINDNTEQDISAADVRNQTNDLTDSCLNIEDDAGVKYGIPYTTPDPVTIGPGWTEVTHSVGKPARQCTVVDTSSGETLPLRFRGLGGDFDNPNAIEVYSNAELTGLKVYLICYT
jgi:hypothetical protein